MPVLSRTQQNDIYKLAEDGGLKIADFDLANHDQGYPRYLTETFTHRPTQAWIDFSLAEGGKYWLKWWPNFQPGESSAFIADWRYVVLPMVQKWVHTVRNNDEAPDLWAEAHKARRITDAAGHVEDDNTPFDPGEIELIKPKLDEIEAFIESKQPLNEEQKRSLHSRFQYLLGAAKRGLGRIDWLNIFVSQIVQLFTDGVVHSSLYGDVMRHAYAALGTVIRVGTKLLGS